MRMATTIKAGKAAGLVLLMTAATLLYWLYATALQVSDLSRQMERVLFVDCLFAAVAVAVCVLQKHRPGLVFSSLVLFFDLSLLLGFALRNANWH
jgi:hypothetical protein